MFNTSGNKGFRTSGGVSGWLISLLLLLRISSLVFVISSNPAAADICKWVDENGVTHYAEQCPESTHGEPVDIQPPPSPMQVRETRKRFGQAGSSDAGQDQREERQARDAPLRAAADADEEARASLCADATVQHETLRETQPVWYAEKGIYRTQGSFENFPLKGSIQYIGEAERQDRIDYYGRLIETNCVGSKLERTKIADRKLDLMSQHICQSSRDSLEDMKSSLSGKLLEDGERELMAILEERIKSWCK